MATKVPHVRNRTAYQQRWRAERRASHDALVAERDALKAQLAARGAPLPGTPPAAAMQPSPPPAPTTAPPPDIAPAASSAPAAPLANPLHAAAPPPSPEEAAAIAAMPPLPGAPVPVAPWEDEAKIAGLTPLTGTLSHLVVHFGCARMGRETPPRDAVEKAGVPRTAAQVMLAWFPSFEMTGKWSLTFGLGFQLVGLVMGATPIDQGPATDAAVAPRGAPTAPATPPSAPPARQAAQKLPDDAPDDNPRPRAPAPAPDDGPMGDADGKIDIA